MIKKIHTLLIMMAFALVANAQNTYTKTSVLSKGNWVKIRVKNEGVYQLTPSALKGMGFSDANKVRLYGYNLPVLPEANIQLLDDDLTEIPLYHNPSGNLLFYSRGTTEWKRKSATTTEFTHLNNPYSNYVYYFLTEDATTAPSTLKQVDAATTSAATQTTYYAHSIIESDAFSFLNCGRTFFESYDFATGSVKSYTVPLAGEPKGNISLKVQFGAAGSSASSLTVATNGTSIGKLSFTKLVDYLYASVSNKTFSVSGITSNKLPLTLTHDRSSDVKGHLDYIQACYETNLSLTSSNYVAFTPNTAGDKVFGITASNKSNIVLLNVTSPSSTCELTGTQATDSYNASVKNASISDLFVALDKTATYPEPEKVGKVANQNLHELTGINLLIIVPSSGKLTAQAQRLADAHTATDGMKCAVVTAEQVYNEFSSGTPDITAYRRLAKMLYDRDNSLQNILLFGACFWDNRLVTSGFSSKNSDDYLLVWESENSWSHTDSYTCEEYITLLDDGEGASPLKDLPDAGVGRIPVTTETEAKGVVDKLISYINNEQAGAWKNTICMLGDDGNANIHMDDAENVLQYTQLAFPDYRFKRIYWDSYERQQSATGNSYPGAYNDINQTMEEGALIMNYTGHGAAYTLSHEQVLKTADFQNWSSPRLPLWLTAACDVCPFDMNTENIACEAVLNPKGGAMGFVSTARTVYSSPNRSINRHFMRRVLDSNDEGERYTIGEALALAKCDIINSRSSLTKLDSINKAHYVLIGDPAIRLLTPTYKVQIDEISGNTAEDGKPILSAGSRTTITGHIVDEDGNKVTNYNGFVSPSIFDSEELITCYNNDGSADSPFTYKDRRRTIYSGTDAIKNGEFSFTFAVPMDLNYSDLVGQMKIYAVNTDHSIEAHGTYEDFYVGGKGDAASTDTIGPKIAVWINNVGFHNGFYVGQNSTLYASLSDPSGINTTGNGVGHDIEAIIDNNEATTYSLNNYFTQTIGDFTSGTVTFPLPELSVGQHTLTFRAFDIFNNPTTVSIYFNVYEGEMSAVMYDMSGRKFSADYRTSLPKGVYIRHITWTKDGEVIDEKTEKMFMK